MTNQPRKSPRRWFQFSLRTLLILVTLVAGLLVAWRAYVEPYRRQRETMTLIEELGGRYKTEPGGLAWMRDWFGADNFQDIVLVDVADCDHPEKYLGQVASLPRLESLVVGSQKFTDEHLSRLKRLTTLSGLVLDSTSVTDDGIEALKQTLPALAIRKSQRRIRAAIWSRGGETESRDGNVVLVGFYGDQFTDMQFAFLAVVPKLKNLNIWATAATDRALVAIGHLKELEYLSLRDNKFTDDALIHLRGLKSLRHLEIMFAPISDKGIKYLKEIHTLEHLCLACTNVTDQGLEYLQGLKKLKSIDLGGTKVTDKGIQKLRKALPNVTVGDF